MWRRSGQRSLGFKTALVEREHLGGICLNWGCIPTKALLRSAEIFHYMKHAENYGLAAKDITFDAAKVVAAFAWRVGPSQHGRQRPAEERTRCTVIWGEAKLTKPDEVVVADTKKAIVQPQNPIPKGVAGAGTYTAKHIIVATGARPRVLPGLEHDGKLVWSYFEAMVPAKDAEVVARRRVRCHRHRVRVVLQRHGR
jgi:dihydrolipoamide dehydrogenase